ncbi:NAD(P)-dependent oxidoreductase [Pantoea sp. CCBC3-3-1]|uniref:NAD(P)-dependent oxidoreductase n=1 Tax=Pantoea sp. CCBC3-3-1 TaxID=2490851 RepID=UPI00143D58CE|nr:NAD(P)-dependent oxidoreductase [Pantoea sp. CCBC3-3-1]
MINISFIGFGEAGGILARDLAAHATVTVWDRKLLNAETRQEMEQKAAASGVRLARSLDEALQNASLIFSTVTASEALNVALTAASNLKAGQTFLDLNSVAPATKLAAAEIVEAAGAAYIDVAVMAPVPPQRLQTPLLLGGTTAETIDGQLRELGFNSQYRSRDVGEASAIKMCRSVMIKGLEALTTECLSAARQYGVEQAVLDSLHASFPSLGWNTTLPDYLISRVAEHGQRRAEEMREVVQTLQDVNVSPAMSLGIVATQQGLVDAIALRGLHYQQLKPFVWQQALERIYPKE